MRGKRNNQIERKMIIHCFFGEISHFLKGGFTYEYTFIICIYYLAHGRHPIQAHSKIDLSFQFHVITLGREKEPLNLTKDR